MSSVNLFTEIDISPAQSHWLTWQSTIEILKINSKKSPFTDKLRHNGLYL